MQNKHEPRPYVIYLSPYDILRPRTNQVSDVRFTEGFAQQNCHAHLIVPFVKRPDNIHRDEVHEIYGLTHALQIHYLPTRFIHDVHGKMQLFTVAFWTVIKTLKILRRRKQRNTTYIISRSTHLLRPFFFLRKLLPSSFKKVFLIHWAHDLHHNRSHRSIYRKSDYLLATNSNLLEDLLKSNGKSRHEGTFTTNPVTQQQAESRISKAEARKEVHLDDINRPIIAYTGKLGRHYDREMRYILEAASLLPDYTFVITGGKPETVEYWRDQAGHDQINNIMFTGYIYDYGRVKYYQYAADVLLSYYTTQGHDTRYNLPNKICEYMLTGNVIVTPDYPATRDLLNSDNCIFTAPEDGKALAAGIREAVENPQASREKAERAYKTVQEHTFRKMARRILDALPK